MAMNALFRYLAIQAGDRRTGGGAPSLRGEVGEPVLAFRWRERRLKAG